VTTLAKEIREHYTAYPHHGVGCVCLDSIARKVREQVVGLTHQQALDCYLGTEVDKKTVGGVRHVLMMLGRSL